MLCPPPDTSPEQPYFSLAYTLGSTSHESTFEDMVLTQTPSFAAGKWVAQDHSARPWQSQC